MSQTKSELWSSRQDPSWKIKVGLAEMLKGGVIMDVTNVEQALIAQAAGAQAGPQPGAGAGPQGGASSGPSMKNAEDADYTVVDDEEKK